MKEKKIKSKTKTLQEIDVMLTPSGNTFPVVGIGASAGGLEAFKKLLHSIPVNSGMAFVLVQHLHPERESMLTEILQSSTTIPVIELSDDVEIEPDHIYILPGNKMFSANEGKLTLGVRVIKKNEPGLPIDLFFTALAEVYQAFSIGVVLSGTASDGTKGLKSIKDHGGLTFAQSEDSAAYDGMPHSAIQAGVVDFILPPEKIFEKLLEITKITHKKIDENGIQVSKPDAPDDEDVYRQILALLRLRKGTDFTYYKQTTIRRRILRRMALSKVEETAAYLNYLREHKSEQDVLFQDLLIPVTSFFRDIKIFENLCENVFSRILKNKSSEETIRIWIAGCSTGQEVYSIAIRLKEFLGEQQQRIQIFATDISEIAIAKARIGIYTMMEMEEVSPARKKKFFNKINGNYQVNKLIRDLCVFATHNFLKDPPFGKMDFISCRNVLIYMEPYLQKKALTTFHYALKSQGFLLLGKSEAITSVTHLFTAAASVDKIFSRKDVPGRFIPVSMPNAEQRLTNDIVPNEEFNGKELGKPLRTDFQKAADEILLLKYTPAGVVVNESMDIVHFRGKTEDFLQQLPGKPTHNLLKMAKEGLAFELRNILHKAKKENAVVVRDNITIILKGLQRHIMIEAMPLPDSVEPYFLVLFHDNNFVQVAEPHNPDLDRDSGLNQTNNLLRIQQLEKELTQAREDMRSITEEQEAVNEELQSANEELLSGSEELQSLNEELETGKEELESTNEELQVVNQEMLGLNAQVSHAKDYAENIISTIRVPLIVLDKNLRIKSANNSFYKTFRLNEIETDGKLIFEISNHQWNIPALRKLLETIIPSKSKIDDFEITHDFPIIGERVMLLNAREMYSEHRTEKLLLLSIEDVTEKATADKKLNDTTKRYQSVLMQSPFAFSLMKGKKMKIEMANQLMKDFWGKGDEVEGKNLLDVLPELIDQPFPELMDQVYTSGEAIYADEIPARLNYNGKSEIRFFNITYQPHLETDGSISGVITVVHEVTDLVNARKNVEVQNKLFQDMLMTSPGFVATLEGPDHIYGLVNPQYQSLFGKRELQGKPMMVALPELEGQGFDTLIDMVYNTGKSYVGINIMIFLARDENLEPEERYFNFSYQPMYGENKEIFSILVFGYEVTDQVNAANKIKESEEQFSTLAESMGNLAWVSDCYGEIYWYNKRWYDYTGTNLQEMEGRGWEKLNHPEHATRVVGFFNDAMKHKDPWELTFPLRGANGAYKWFLTRAVPIVDNTGKINRWIGTNTDITAQIEAEENLKQSEQNFRQLAELMPEKVFHADAMGIIRYYNQSWLIYTGLNLDELISKGWDSILHPDDLKAYTNQQMNALTTGGNFEMEVRLKNTKGEFIWHLSRSIAVKDNASNIIRCITTTTEIQKQKELTEILETAVKERTLQLAKTNEELVRMNKELHSFTYISSHDMQEPLRKIQTFSGRIIESEQKNLSESGLYYFQRMQESANRMQKLIQDLLAFTRLTTYERKFTVLNLNDIVEQVKIDFKDTLLEKQATIEIKEMCEVHIIPFQFLQLMNNLISNALKFSRKGVKPHISISCRKVNASEVSMEMIPNTEYHHITISDNGIGFEPKFSEKIFDIFQRLHGKEEFEGTGIGLSIVKKIIENHRGFIRATSELNQGAKFDIYIPAAQ